jgi:hypothetical protein
MNAKDRLKRCVDKLYGGLNMSWLMVILFAVGVALLTAVFLIVPVFEGTSFERMGVTFEAWIFFAVIIMANCKKPLEAALKTFVFFLISQPLIYLFQVPFSYMGWQLFNYYGYWFRLTLLTFPAAFVGWYINRKNWLSVLIFAPVLALLGSLAFDTGSACVHHFPHLLLAALFCLLQIALYIAVFFADVRKKAVGIVIPLIVIIAMAATASRVNVAQAQALPGEVQFSEEADIRVEDSSVAEVQITMPEEGIVYIVAHKRGSTDFVITDAGQEYRYTVEIYEEDGINHMRVTQKSV